MFLLDQLPSKVPSLETCSKWKFSICIPGSILTAKLTVSMYVLISRICAVYFEPYVTVPDVNMNTQAAAWWGFHYGINGGMEGKADLLGE